MIRTNSKSIAKALAGTALLALAAVGLAGCSDRAGEADVKSEDGAGARALLPEPRGLPLEHGDLPTGGPDSKRGLTFTPAYYTMVYLKFEGGAHIVAKHAYFHRLIGDKNEPEFTDDAFITCAIEYLKNRTANGDCEPFGTKPEDHAVPTIYENFDRFRFGSQQRVYVFVDNNDVAFNTYPISFTPFGSNERPDPSVKPRERNLSFYHAKPGQRPGSTRLSLLSFANYFRGKNGGGISLEADNADFSINFNLLACRAPDGNGTCDFSDKEQTIAFAIDPDTGNGWGSEPFQTN